MYDSIKRYNKHFKIKTRKKAIPSNDESKALRSAIERTENTLDYCLIKPDAVSQPKEVLVREACNLMRAAMSLLVQLNINDPEPIINALVDADIKGKQLGPHGEIIKTGHFKSADIKRWI